MRVLPEPLKFEWDSGNNTKNENRHGVTMQECEEAFFDEEKILSHDLAHSNTESRYVVLGRTQESRILYIVFTIRNYHFVRVISARDVDKKERILYEKAIAYTKV